MKKPAKGKPKKYGVELWCHGCGLHFTMKRGNINNGDEALFEDSPEWKGRVAECGFCAACFVWDAKRGWVPWDAFSDKEIPQEEARKMAEEKAKRWA